MADGRVVAVGASAGGVTALRRLAAGLPADFPAPLLVVQHVGSHPSVLPELLATAGPLRATHAVHGEALRPGHIFVAPPDHHMLVEDRRIVLSRGPKEHHSRPAIDPTLLSLAIDSGPAAIGVILTGHLDDGTAGLQAIKDCGGLAVVQEPSEAEAPSMPASAMAYVRVDRRARIAEMGALLAELAASPLCAAPSPARARVRELDVFLARGDPMENLSEIGEPSALACPECHGGLWEIESAIPARYRCHTGHGYTARTLLHAYAEESDMAMWNAVRALQEESILLRRMARVRRSAGDEAAVGKLAGVAAALEARAEELRRFAEATREAGDESMTGP